MPWSVAGLRLGRDWVAAPGPGALRARWAALTAAEGAERERLFRPSRSRGPAAGAAAGAGGRRRGPAPAPRRPALRPGPPAVVPEDRRG
ncbi:DNA methyltransferase, partial [Streptomyces sp. NPDC006529]